jgi:putative SOS response-associated peptidase YedK
MFRHRRCVAVVEGWYEWLLLDGKKVRYLFTAADGDLLYFPAVYRERVATTEPRAYATVTCDPGDLVARYHHREPVTLSADDVARWLDPATSREALIAMLVPAPSGRLAVAPSPASETARALKPAPSPPAQGSLFDVEPKKRRPS